MNLIWDPETPKTWDAFAREHGVAMQQAWLYGEALKRLGVRIHRAQVEHEGRVVALAQFMCRRIPAYLTLASCTRGPVWHHELAAGERREVLRRLRREIPTPRLRVTLFSPDQTADELESSEVSGMLRVMTGYSTVMLDLEQSPDTLRAGFEGRWRNRLVKAEAERGLQVYTNSSLTKCRELLDREAKQRQARNFHGLPTQFVDAWVDAAGSTAAAFLLSRADFGGKTIAAMLFLLHGSVATYHIGWADDRGRELNAHNLLLWRATQALRERGIASLDLGGVNTRSLPGISRFKLGTGGQVRTLAGSFY
jgi:lipid II:glycine glycyltransferase (peptidoglycan interpeptide bridge formation enzyme)